VQDEIVIGDEAKVSRWVFRDISETTFKWEAHVSKDNQESWQLRQEVFARRKADT
jgi:hypothetical protein